MRGIFISFLVNLVVFSALGQDFESHQLFVRIKMDKALSVTEFEKEFLNNNVQYSSVIPVFKTKELQNIFLVTLFENEKLEKSIEILSRNTLIDYVEKVPIYKFFYTPNDPQYASQWNLSKIKADLAWNINQGSNQIKIAVTDDGFLLTHQDLASQWAINSGEIVGNGIDDDNNGYIDDWRGWDAADNDNDPSAFNASNTYFTHGTHVSGIVGAATNNSLGIGSISFNCKIIPVKIGTNTNGSLLGAYQGLEYAINTDARVINMSWGGAAYSATYQLLFNLAKSKGIVCVAAAGNSSSSIPMYPASYNNVISVASTVNTDGLSSFSNYGSTIDVCAPGSSILSTLAGSTSSYGNLSGTSMASPLVAGLCGLMISNNPSLIPDSVEACLKRTCDNINAQNTSRIGQIGAGRINAYQALLCTQKAPIANFTTNFSSQCTGKPVQYLSTSAGNMPMTYSWSFPGGTPSTSTQMNPSVTYNMNGLKTATLTVTNSLGTDTKTISNLVNITSPTATLSGNVSVYGSSTAYLAINFTGNPPFSVTLTDGTNTFTKNNITQNPYFFPIIPLKDTSNIIISSFSDSMCVGNYSGSGVIYKKSGSSNNVKCIDSVIYYSDTSNWYYQNASGNWVKSTLGLNNCGQSSHTWSPINLIGLQNADQMIWGDINSTTCTLKRDINIVDINKIDSFRILVQGDDNVLSLKVNGTFLASTPFGWNNVASVLVAKSMLINGNNTITIEGTNSGGCKWVALKMKIYTDFCNTSTIPCDTSTLDNGLMLHLPFNGNTLDVSGKGNHATNYGATAVAGKDGLANTAYRFNGSSNYMKVTANSTLSKGGLKTIMMLYQPKGFFQGTCHGNQIIYSGTDGNGLGIRYSDRMVNSNHCSTPPDSLNENFYAINGWVGSPQNTPYYPRVTKDTWYCLALIQDSFSLKMYVNGVLVGKENNAYNSNTGIDDWYIGKNSISSFFANGVIDDIRIYNRALDSNEVKAYCGTCEVVNTPTSPCDTTTLDNGLMLHLPFNGNTLDASGNGNHATNYGATAVAGKDGVANTAYRFNGSSNYMEITNSSSLNPSSSITITSIIKLDAHNPTPGWFASNILSKSADNSIGNINLRITNGIWNVADTNNSFFVGDFNKTSYQLPSNYLSILKVPQYVQTNSWYCVVYTFDGDSCRMYINGKLKWSIKSNDNSLISSASGIRIGRSYNNSPDQYYFNGLMDDIRIYNRAITSDEVKAYCGTCEVVNTPTIPCDTSTLDNGLIAYYPLDGDANDLSGNGNHGTAYGGLQYISGKRGLAANYDGIDDYINLNKKLLSGLNDFTITGWTYLNQALAHPKSFNIYRENNAGWNGSGLDVTISNFNLSKYTLQAGWNSYKGGSMQNFVVRDDNIDSGRWYCFTVTRKQGYLKLYLGGVLIQTVLDSFTTSPLYNGILGGWWFNNDPSQIGFSKGYLDDIRFYNRALDSNEIKAYCGTCEVGNTKCPNTFSKIIFKKCNSDSIILSANNGNSYVWSPNQSLSNNMIKSPICFAKNNMVYTVSYIDSLNCQHIDTFIVSVKPKINFNPIPDQLICIGDSTQLLIPISGNNITWTPNLEINNNTIKNPIVYPSQNRTYSVEFKDSLGCSQSDSVAIRLKKCCNDRASFTINDSLLCHPDSINIVNTSKNLITPKFSWFFGNAIPSQYTGVKPPKVFFNSYSDYIINLILDNGTCQDTFSKKIYVLKTPAYAGKDSSFCKSQVIDFPLGESGLSELLYSWIPTDGLDNPNISNPNLTTQKSNTYILKVYSPETKCFAYDTVRIQVNENVPLEIIPSHINHVEANVEVTLTAKGRNYYMWHNGMNSNTIKYVARADSTFYVIGYSDSICFDTAYYRVLIKKPYFIGFPSAFSPNNDGVNELFKPNFYGEVEDINFSIYSKWGEKIFEGEGTNAGWNGYYKGELIEVGTYVYILRYRIYGKNELKKGSFVLIK